MITFIVKLIHFSVNEIDIVHLYLGLDWLFISLEKQCYDILHGFLVFGLERWGFQKFQVPPFYVITSVEIYLLTVQILFIGVL